MEIMKRDAEPDEPELEHAPLHEPLRAEWISSQSSKTKTT